MRMSFLYMAAVVLALMLPPAVSAAPTARYSLGSGGNGEPTLFVDGAGATVTLPEIERGLRALDPASDGLVLEDPDNRVWRANISLLIGRDVTLRLSSDAVGWLKLRSNASASSSYDYASFATLKTYNGNILIDGVKITSWDTAANTYDTEVANGRSYLLAKYNARMDIRNAELSYLGSADGESYGVSWRDTNSSDQPDVLLTRVTGEVINSTFSYNYYGIYTYQASNMLFRGNTFAHNLGYGFDPHDFSHHFLVENNQAFNNGNHGFIISRGCNNFVIRGNISHSNQYRIGSDSRRAHGFMLDHGSPSSQDPQIGSDNNLLENNQAYDNQGYGLRVLGSSKNTIRGNTFRNNQQGVTLEQGSSENVLENNVISGNGVYGVYLLSAARGNVVKQNSIHANRGVGIRANGADVVDNRWQENQVYGNGAGGITITGGAQGGITPPQLVRSGNQVSGTTTPGATVELYSDHGGQGRFFEASTTAGSDGSFVVERPWQGTNINATVTVGSTSSAFAVNGGTFIERSRSYLPLVAR